MNETGGLPWRQSSCFLLGAVCKSAHGLGEILLLGSGGQSPSPPPADEKQGQQQGKPAAAPGGGQQGRLPLVQQQDLSLNRCLEDQIAAVRLPLHKGPVPVLPEGGPRVLRPLRPQAEGDGVLLAARHRVGPCSHRGTAIHSALLHGLGAEGQLGVRGEDPLGQQGGNVLPAGQGGGGILEFRLQHHGAAEILSREEEPLTVKR